MADKKDRWKFYGIVFASVVGPLALLAYTKVGDFLTGIIPSLAWPAALVSLGVLFRHPIARLIDRLKSIGSEKINADFSGVADALVEFSHEQQVITPTKSNHPSFDEYCSVLVEILILSAGLNRISESENEKENPIFRSVYSKAEKKLHETFDRMRENGYSIEIEKIVNRIELLANAGAIEPIDLSNHKQKIQKALDC